MIPQVVSPGAARRRAQGPRRRRRIRPSAARPATRRRSRPRAPSSPSARTAPAPGAAGSCSSTSSRAARWTSTGSARSRSRSCSDAGLVSDAADLYRPDARSSSSSSRASARSRRASLARARSSASKERPFGRVLFAIGHRGGRRRHRAQPRPALPHRSTRCSAATPRADRGDAGRRAEDGRDRSPSSSPTTQMRELIADLREVGLRFEEEGPPPGEGPLRGQDVRADRHAARPHRASRRRSGSSPPAGASPRRCRRRPTTSWPATSRARSSRRPSGSASTVLDEPGLLGLLDGAS